MAKISNKGARNKGKHLEREVAKSLKQIGIEAQRVPLSGALSWLKGDVVEFNTIQPHLHECKNCEELSLNTWWKQAVEQVKNGEIPLLHFTSNYQSIYTMMTTEDFDFLTNAYETCRKLEIKISVFEIPPRKHFWKWLKKQKTTKFSAFLYNSNGQELVITTFDFYLMLRRQDIKYRAQGVIMQPQTV